MTAIEFLAVSVGSGIFMVCAAYTFRIITEIRARGRTHQGEKLIAVHDDEPLDPMAQRLQEIRNARFGVPMKSPRTAETWPVMWEKQKRIKNEEKRKKRR